jgi:hypothetical protein
MRIFSARQRMMAHRNKWSMSILTRHTLITWTTSHCTLHQVLFSSPSLVSSNATAFSPPGSWGSRPPTARKTLFIDILETSEWAADGSPSSLGLKLVTAVERHFVLLCRDKTSLTRKVQSTETLKPLRNFVQSTFGNEFFSVPYVTCTSKMLRVAYCKEGRIDETFNRFSQNSFFQVTCTYCKDWP